jgi:hypothetical protein
MKKEQQILTMQLGFRRKFSLRNPELDSTMTPK